MQFIAFNSSVITSTSGHFHNDTFDAGFVCLSLEYKQGGSYVQMLCFHCQKEKAGLHM